MNNPPVVSIIICTANRAEQLRQTLHALAEVRVPANLPAELLVVDNASTDHTAQVVRECRLPAVAVRYVFAAQRGKGNAYNAGLAAARGEIFLFSDDDVCPPQDWIGKMCAPILTGTADAVVGGVRLAAHLSRSWLTDVHKDWLAITDMKPLEAMSNLTGANMAFSRRVLEKVPQFDPELGPGALGSADDTLFSYQLREAGYRIVAVPDALAEHCFEESRLTRRSFLEQAKKRGEFAAYVAHHWRHEDWSHPYRRLAVAWWKLQFARLKNWRAWRAAECAPAWELPLLQRYFTAKHYLVERRRPRNFEERGLVKLSHGNHLSGRQH